MIEEKRHDLLESLFSNVHRPVNAIARLGPIHFSRGDVPGESRAAVAEFDLQQISAQDHGHTMEWIAVPRAGFSRQQTLSADEVISPVMQHFLTGSPIAHAAQGSV
jgi:hypothetical protein